MKLENSSASFVLSVKINTVPPVRCKWLPPAELHCSFLNGVLTGVISSLCIHTNDQLIKTVAK